MSAYPLSVVTDLASCLEPLLNSDRHHLDSVRFVGSKTDLVAFATNNHVLGVVTVVGDFSRFGDVMLPGSIARRLAYRDWDVKPWSDPEHDKFLTAEPYLLPAHDSLRLADLEKVMPVSKAPAASAGWFLGKPLIAVGEVLHRLGFQAQLSGNPAAHDPLRIDSPPAVRVEGGELMWVSFAVMPSRRVDCGRGR